MNTQNFIILKTQAYKDSDLIVHALSKAGARFHFIARGARKSRKRFGGGLLEAMNYVELTYDDRKNKDQFIPLNEAKLLKGFEGVRQDYDRLRTGLGFVHDVLSLTREGESMNQPLFNLLGNALNQLEMSQALSLLRLQYRIKLLSFTGFLPNEDGAFTPFVAAPLKENNKLSKYYKSELKKKSDRVFQELTS